MLLRLDQPISVPKVVDLSIRPPTIGGDYFKQYSISLAGGHREKISLTAAAASASYSFDLAFDYKVAGKKYTQVLQYQGHPFRVAPDLCIHNYTYIGDIVSPSDASQLKKYSYQAVNRMMQEQNGLVLSPTDSSTYMLSQDCGAR